MEQLDGDLAALKAEFVAGKDGIAFAADRVELGGSVFLHETHVQGDVVFTSAKIKRTLQTDGSTLLDGCLALTAAQIGEIVDNESGWPLSIKLDRCHYGAFILESATDAEARIRWLSLQDGAYPPGTFHPQPWEECARVLREAGHTGDARKILIEKEHRQRKARRAQLRREYLFEDAYLAAVRDAILRVTIRYGRQPLLAFAWLFGMLVLGATIFDRTADIGAIKPNLPQVLRAGEWVECADGGKRRGGHATQVDCFLSQPEAASYPRFNAFMYAADTLFPVVSFEVQAYWLPDDRTPPGAWARAYLWVHITAGWALTLLAVAGFSGLVKSDSR
jgi:hypothetical protein